MEENSQSSKSSSDVQVISDLEKHVEEIFHWTLKGLILQGHLSKHNAHEVKRVFLETFKKLEFEELITESPETRSTEEFQVNNLNKEDNLLSPVSPDETQGKVNFDAENYWSSNELHRQGTEDNIATEYNDVSEKYYASLKEIVIHTKTYQAHVSMTHIEALWNSTDAFENFEYLDSIEGEISCSTENTGDMDEEDIVGNVNYVLNSLSARESPSSVKNLFQSKLQITHPDDVNSFVEICFKECLLNTKFLNSFAQLIEMSQSISGQIPSELKRATWKKCLETFEGANVVNSADLGFSSSKNPWDIEKLTSVIKKNLEQVFEKDNITLLVGLLFQRGLVDLQTFAPFVCTLFELAVKKCNSFFRYFCSLLSTVGQQFQNELMYGKNHPEKCITIKLMTSNGQVQDVSSGKLVESLFANMRDYYLTHIKTLSKEIVDSIKSLIRLKVNNWKVDANSSPSTDEKYQKIPHSPEVPGDSNVPGSSTMQQSQNKHSDKQRTFKSKTSRPNEIRRKTNQEKFNRKSKTPRNIATNLRFKNMQMEKQMQKQQEILLATQQLVLDHMNTATGPHVRNNVPNSHRRGTPASRSTQQERQNIGNRTRRRRNPNYGPDPLPNVSESIKRNRGGQGSRSRREWQRSIDSRLPKNKDVLNVNRNF